MWKIRMDFPICTCQMLAFCSMLPRSIRTTCTQCLRMNTLKEKGVVKIFFAQVKPPIVQSIHMLSYENRLWKKFGFGVRFNLSHQNIICECKKYSESGIHSCYCLCNFNVHCVPKVPNQYILKWWTRLAWPPWVVEEGVSGNASSVPSSIWRVQMHRQFETLLLASESNS